MGRLHAPELEDQSWFPDVLRDAGTAFLRFGAEKLGQARAIRPIIESALTRSQRTNVVDLCSGGGGPIVAIARSLRKSGRDVEVVMTDLFPSHSARALATRDGDDYITYSSTPVDATAVPAEYTGLRTMFNAFHHFRPAGATRVLRDAVDSRAPIAIVEVLRRNPLALLAMLFVPVVTLFVVPFLRPFRWSWLLWTYVIPVIPLFIWWDGTMSVLRAYNPSDIEPLIRAADPDDAFDWQIDDLRISGQPVRGVVIVGIPKE
jgi:hypothetical protein